MHMYTYIPMCVSRSKHLDTQENSFALHELEKSCCTAQDTMEDKCCSLLSDSLDTSCVFFGSRWAKCYVGPQLKGLGVTLTAEQYPDHREIITTGSKNKVPSWNVHLPKADLFNRCASALAYASSMPATTLAC